MDEVKSNGLIIDPGLCRCCRSIKKCRILTKEYVFKGEKEVYADMMMDSFGIILSHLDDNERDRGICATCVSCLRVALSFRRQVLQCEEVFLQARLNLGVKDVDLDTVNDTLQDMTKKLEMQLKDEPKEELSDQESLGHDDAPMEYGGDDDDEEEKPEKKEDIPLEAEKEESKPVFSDDDDVPLIFKAKKKKVSTKKTKNSKSTKKSENKTTNKKSGAILKKPIKHLEKRDTTERDLDYMAEENLLSIIEFSYVCPFKNRRNNYYCFYCKEYFPKPEDLREHTIKHDTKPFQMIMGYKKMPKVDVTRIDCKLCDTKINNLDEFKTHINSLHQKKIYFEAPEKMIPYKLTWNNLVCVLCSNVFEDFNALNSHMVGHYSNFTCDVCGMCFLEKTRLDAHLKRHKDSEKHTCEICGKIFKSNHYKDMHIDIVHRKKAIIRCPKCDECFMSYALKNKHLSDFHGQKRVYPCNLCDKVYNRQKTLTEHQRRNHQKVFKHQCTYCEQKFYLPSRLKEHIAMHTGERNYRCEYCEKSYPRLKSLQYHIRTHTNDRRYRCNVCGQTFIQNTSLKSHVKTHHPQCDVEALYF